MTAAFDTLSAARDMERAGLEREAAELSPERSGPGKAGWQPKRTWTRCKRRPGPGSRRCDG